MNKSKILFKLLIITFVLFSTHNCVSQQYNNITLNATPIFIIQNDYDINMIKQLMTINFDPRYYNDELYKRVKNNFFIAEYYLGKIQAKIDILYSLAKIREQEEAKLKQEINNANGYDMDVPVYRNNTNQKFHIAGYESEQYLLTQLYRLYKNQFNELLTNYINPKGTNIAYYTSLFGHVNQVKFLSIATNNYNKGYADAGGMTQKQYKIKKLGVFLTGFFFNAGGMQTASTPASAAIKFLQILSETY